MKSIAIQINDGERRIFSAGEEQSVVIAQIRFGPDDDELSLSVTGMDAETNEYLEWHQPAIIVGDRVTLQAIESDISEPPSERTVHEEASIVEQYRHHLSALAKLIPAEDRADVLLELTAALSQTED